MTVNLTKEDEGCFTIQTNVYYLNINLNLV